MGITHVGGRVVTVSITSGRRFGWWSSESRWWSYSGWRAVGRHNSVGGRVVGITKLEGGWCA